VAPLDEFGEESFSRVIEAGQPGRDIHHALRELEAGGVDRRQ
jgi:hypothetical protein